MTSPPYMPFYVGDYLADTTHLTTLEHGAYLLLLATMWRAGGTLPNDDAKLSRFARLTPAQWARIKPAIMPFFDDENGQITQGRLAREMERHAKAVKQRRDSGSLGGKAKALKYQDNVVALATISPKQPEPEPEREEKDADASQKKAVSKVLRGSRIPPDWSPSSACLTFAESLGMSPREISHEADQFRDYWRGRAGAGGLKLDWPATWRKWVRRNYGPDASVADRAKSGGSRSGPVDFASLIARGRGGA